MWTVAPSLTVALPVYTTIWWPPFVSHMSRLSSLPTSPQTSLPQRHRLCEREMEARRRSPVRPHYPVQCSLLDPHLKPVNALCAPSPHPFLVFPKNIVYTPTSSPKARVLHPFLLTFPNPSPNSNCTSFIQIRRPRYHLRCNRRHALPHYITQIKLVNLFSPPASTNQYSLVSITSATKVAPRCWPKASHLSRLAFSAPSKRPLRLCEAPPACTE